ncbi:hypothetical protein IE81DRAFT_323315 [Ceraceosorus guamensis]|uniref:Protein kinase domain-containing protein n=1 Tax=Ceraceosorus guamensis TaxID=1522189 RepID=A0A316W0A8_9BASI|nr:hypothetical protein IE81DRAFT_323315 [Ceraceosorus guamensis]PWN42558.1 hypothetical protein IE81DRAFT_323315 [Ceraceosorus guamensis]
MAATARRPLGDTSNLPSAYTSTRQTDLVDPSTPRKYVGGIASAAPALEEDSPLPAPPSMTARLGGGGVAGMGNGPKYEEEEEEEDAAPRGAAILGERLAGGDHLGRGDIDEAMARAYKANALNGSGSSSPEPKRVRSSAGSLRHAASSSSAENTPPAGQAWRDGHQGQRQDLGSRLGTRNLERRTSAHGRSLGGLLGMGAPSEKADAYDEERYKHARSTSHASRPPLGSHRSSNGAYSNPRSGMDETSARGSEAQIPLSGVSSRHGRVSSMGTSMLASMSDRHERASTARPLDSRLRGNQSPSPTAAGASSPPDENVVPSRRTSDGSDRSKQSPRVDSSSPREVAAREAAHVGTGTAYETPAHARSYRAGSALAASTLRPTNPPRSTARNLRTNGRASSTHVPARRVPVAMLAPEPEEVESSASRSDSPQEARSASEADPGHDVGAAAQRPTSSRRELSSSPVDRQGALRPYSPATDPRRTSRPESRLGSERHHSRQGTHKDGADAPLGEPQIEVTLGADEEDEQEGEADDMEALRSKHSGSQAIASQGTAVAEHPPAPARSEMHPAAARRQSVLGKAMPNLPRQGVGVGIAPRPADQRAAPRPPEGAKRYVSAPAQAARTSSRHQEDEILAASRAPSALRPSAMEDVVAPTLDAEVDEHEQLDENDLLRIKLEEHDRARYPDAVDLEIRRQQDAGNRYFSMERRNGKSLAECKETSFRGIKFKKLQRLGDGGFSSVWAVRGPMQRASEDGTYFEPAAEDETALFAMKHISLKRLEPQSRVDLLREVETLQALAEKPGYEQYILRYFGHKSSSSALKILIEVGDRDFSTVLKQGPLPPTEIARYWVQMLEAVQFIHVQAGLVHTDLKPANFLVVGDRLKLIDFGIAQKIPIGTVHISRSNIIGTPNYMAPETIFAHEQRGVSLASEDRAKRTYKAGKPSDVWSLGCILYQMVYGRPPFDAIRSDRKLAAICDVNHQIPFDNKRRDDNGSEVGDVKPPLIESMRQSLLWDAKKRATIRELLSMELACPKTITIDQWTMRDLIRRLYTSCEEMGEDNINMYADRAFANLYERQHAPHQSEAED